MKLVWACATFSSPLVGEGCEALANAVSLGVAGWGGPPHEPERASAHTSRHPYVRHDIRSCGGTPHPNLPPQGGKGLFYEGARA
jgi:hypothetical protein